MRRADKPSAIETGQYYEDRALAYLQGQGLRLLARNYRCRFGELDLVMLDGKEVVFVEVRMRRSDAYGGAVASIDHRKLAKLERSGQNYLERNFAPARLPLHRFDLIAIDGGKLSWLKSFNVH